jgi:hypothetical protein
MSGSLEFIEGGHKLISYGSAFDKIKDRKDDSVLVFGGDENEALMEELDEDDNIVWKAVFPSIIHKVYKTTFYGEPGKGKITEAPNYSVSAFKPCDGQDPGKHLGEKTDISSFKSELARAEKLDGSFFVKINRAQIITEYDRSDEIKILFIDDSDNGRMFTYKKRGEMPPIVNSDMYGVRINGLKGEQKAYVYISGTWYDTGKIFDFD